jgi:hypothetical protein
MPPVVLIIALLGSFHAAQAAPPPAPVAEGVSPNIITPYTSGGCVDVNSPCYRVFGSSDPNADIKEIFVTVTDEFGLGFTAAAVVVTKDDPGAGLQKGDWYASPNVTNLGIHSATTSNPAAESTLTFAAFAKSSTGETSPLGTSVTAIKRAATVQDMTAPVFTRTSGPNGNWCRNYSCGGIIFQPTALGPPLIQGETPCDPGWRSRSPELFGTTPCSRDQLVTGTVEDKTNSSFGLASEIADIIVTVAKASDHSVVKEYHAAIRRGTFASYNVALKIADYEDNIEYEWTVRAIDARGFSAAEETGTFTVTP